jgi:transaldolase
MRIFIDSADIDQIKEAYAWGIVDGITTNPSLIKKAVENAKKKGDSASLETQIERILAVAGDTPVSLEVIGTTEAEMTTQGLYLFDRFNGIAGNVVVKIPVNPGLEANAKVRFDALKSIKTLADRGIPVNTTLIFTAEQAMLAAKAGARYVSPFAGRIDDDLRAKFGLPGGKTDYFPILGKKVAQGGDEDGFAHDGGTRSGVQLIEDCVQVFANYGFDCEVLAASLRNPRQVRECALAGADVATIPFDVLQLMLEHHKTVEGMKAFVADIVPEYADLFKKAKA